MRQHARVLVQGITGKQGTFWTEKMIGCGTQVVAGVNPKRAGEQHLGVPVFASATEAMATAPYDIAVMFIPPAARQSGGARCHRGRRQDCSSILTEHIPAQDVMAMLLAARGAGTRIVGPNTAGSSRRARASSASCRGIIRTSFSPARSA